MTCFLRYGDWMTPISGQTTYDIFVFTGRKAGLYNLMRLNGHQQLDQICCQKTLAIKDAHKDESVTGKLEPSVTSRE